MSQQFFPLKYYLDSNYSNELSRNQVDEILVAMSKTAPGKSNEITIYIQSQAEEEITINAKIFDDDTDMIIPERMAPMSKGTLQFIYHPKKDRRTSLNAPWELEIEVG